MQPGAAAAAEGAVAMSVAGRNKHRQSRHLPSSVTTGHKVCLVLHESATSDNGFMYVKGRQLYQPSRFSQRKQRFSSSSCHAQWQKLRNLETPSVESFRESCFVPSEPATLNGSFRELPAAKNWFHNMGAKSSLRLEYLQPFKGTAVPMELTRKLGQDTRFDRAKVPLGVFLDWAAMTAHEDPSRLYIAQAPLASLPDELQRDLQTPEMVLHAGRGDVYDANLWMGISPTYTPLHKDPNPNLFVQLAGHKIVRVLPPAEGEALFTQVQEALGKSASTSFRGNEMMQGQERVLLERYIWGDLDDGAASPALGGFEAELEGGDGMFIPKGFWHSIKGTGTGVTASVNWWFR